CYHCVYPCFLLAPAPTDLYTLSLHDALPISHRREVGPRVRLAHADREEAPAGRDLGQVLAALLLRAEAQDEGTALAVGDPVRRHGRVRREQFLGDDEPLEHAALTAAIGPGPRHADPAALAEPSREIGIVVGREVAPALPAAFGALLRNELAD